MNLILGHCQVWLGCFYFAKQMSINYDKSENKPDIDIVYAKLTVSRQNKFKLELSKNKLFEEK